MKCPKNKQCPKTNSSTKQFLIRMRDYKKPLCKKCDGGKDNEKNCSTYSC